MNKQKAKDACSSQAQNKLGPKIWGTIGGLIAGLFLVLFGLKKLLLILLLALVGYVLGRFLESEKIVARVHKLLSLLFR